MYDKIKDGYDLFIKKSKNNSLIGTLTLKEGENDYKDIDLVETVDMKFLEKYKYISNILDEEHALFVSYHPQNHNFFVSIREKAPTGEYHDMVTWNHIIVSQKKELSDAFNRLEEKVQNKEEGSFSK